MAVNDKLHSIDHILPWLGAKSFVMIPVNSVAKDSQITYVAFLRGINVGGNKLIKMTQLKQAFESLGEIRERFGADDWLTSRLEQLDADPTHGLKIVREALSRYDPCMRAAVRALWRETDTR